MEKQIQQFDGTLKRLNKWRRQRRRQNAFQPNQKLKWTKWSTTEKKRRKIVSRMTSSSNGLNWETWEWNINSVSSL